jgi:hypothetical protein
MTPRSGARSITPQDMIWKSAKLFWIVRRCHHQHRWHRVPDGAKPGKSPNDDEQMGEINVIFEGSMSIASKT